MAKRPQLTGRAAILAVVVCAIAMSLAYPFREYIAQRRQIAELEQEQAQALQHLRNLEDQRRKLEDPDYIKQLAKKRLHYCEPDAKCYVLLDGKDKTVTVKAEAKKSGTAPWYVTLWQSVQAADAGDGQKAAS
ncbi:septum formation initiator family protein [Microtetraspora sp. AC03309]|uniref:FtsB family cell division protein n=1 Tax=Microtetraspora sp. AC03309 TaxID=2779376 RepID=UPI001E3078FD|nr:septum formation initiator family protein [Microtetraspora sp. AC03309]MCC5574243.1 septum formation initiator family protein [Microtetraspora sp. AC03309]